MDGIRQLQRAADRTELLPDVTQEAKDGFRLGRPVSLDDGGLRVRLVLPKGGKAILGEERKAILRREQRGSGLREVCGNPLVADTEQRKGQRSYDSRAVLARPTTEYQSCLRVSNQSDCTSHLGAMASARVYRPRGCSCLSP